MIHCLLIGDNKQIQYYSNLVGQIDYFDKPEILTLESDTLIAAIDFSMYDAILLLIPLKNTFVLLADAIRAKANLFFVDQPHLLLPEIQALNKLHYEASNLMYPCISELKHPLIEDFLLTSGKHLLYRYNKNIQSKAQMRNTLLNALSFITVLCPMQVKNIDINTLDAHDAGSPALKIRLKLYDSSVAYIILTYTASRDHNILIESVNGNFTFHFSENYLENTHGFRFTASEISDAELDMKTLSDFALCIILNQKPLSNFFHYSLVFKLLKNIENILPRYS